MQQQLSLLKSAKRQSDSHGDTTAAPLENGGIDSVWDEKLDGFDNGIRVIAARLWRMILEGNGYGVTPSRDPTGRYDGPSKDCLWNGTGRQRIPKGLSRRRGNDKDEDEEKDRDKNGGDSGKGRDPGDGDDGGLMQCQVAMKFEPPSLTGSKKPALDSLSDIMPTPQFSKLQRLEDGQLEYFPIYGNGFREQALRTEHHSYPGKVDCTYQGRINISPVEMQEHIAQNAEMQQLRETWLRRERWPRLRRILVNGGNASLRVAKAVALGSDTVAFFIVNNKNESRTRPKIRYYGCRLRNV